LLLAHLPADREALIGDLLEEFHYGRSRAWFWRQLLTAVGLALFRQRTPVTLGLDDSRWGDVEPNGPFTISPATMNVGGIGTKHVGGSAFWPSAFSQRL
jgi:hypothetical protein